MQTTEQGECHLIPIASPLDAIILLCAVGLFFTVIDGVGDWPDE